MPSPPLLYYATVREYKHHYDKYYCRAQIFTFDGIRVYFGSQKFGHAFYENSQRRNGPKDEFSPTRAQRMDWIKLTLEHPDAEHFTGWNPKRKDHEQTRRVTIVYEDFVVIVELSLDRQGALKGNFVTCYVADNSIARIRRSPVWNLEKCMKMLGKEKDCR